MGCSTHPLPLRGDQVAQLLVTLFARSRPGSRPASRGPGLDLFAPLRGDSLPLDSAVQPPALRFVFTGGLVFALAAALIVGLRQEGGNVLLEVAVVATINIASLMPALAWMLLVRGLVPEFVFRRPPLVRAALLSYGAYAIAGLVSGAARVALMGLAGHYVGGGSLVGTVVSDLTANLLLTLLLGAMANQYYAALGRIRLQQRALLARVGELEHSRRLIAATEDRQRRDVAEVLHGRVQTRLVVAWHRLGECERLLGSDLPAAQALLAQVRDQIEEVRESDIRRLSHALHPALIQMGLVPAIRSLAQRFEDHLRVTVHADEQVLAHDSVADNRLPEPLRLAVYRLAEEGLGNVLRHAEAKRVDIHLTMADAYRLAVTVQDDGRGCDANSIQPSFGLASISARVGSLGGNWEIVSEPEKGTTLRATLPVVSEARETPEASRQ